MNPVLIIRAVCLGVAAIGGGIFGLGVHYGIEKPLVARYERRRLADMDAVRYQPVATVDDPQERLDRIEDELADEEAH